jgi:hypothetical protein
MWVRPARADIPEPAEITFYFELNGRPYEKPVSFTILCYGYDTGIPPVTKEPGSYTPEQVYTYSRTCPTYGCVMNEDLYFNYIHIDTCDLVGKAEGRTFAVDDYASFPFKAGDGLGYTVRIELPPSAGLVSSSPLGPRAVAAGGSRAAAFLLALAVTLAVELAVLVVLARYVVRLWHLGAWRIVLAGMLASALTLPLLWFAVPAVIGPRYYLVVGELLVCVIETVVYRLLLRVGWGRAALLSLATNAVSLAVGLAVY